MVTIQQLNCFLSVAKNMSFIRASEELFISQPAVSHHINMLEKQLGTTLILRDKHKVLLTDAGERFYLEIMDVMTQLDYALRTVQGNSILPEILHIGFENTVEIHKLSEIFSEYIKIKPNVRFHCHGVELSEATKMFNNNKLDILFTTCKTLNSSDELFYPLFRGRFCCIMRNDNPLASKDKILPKDLANCTLIFAEKRNCSSEMENLQRSLHMQYPSINIHFSTSAHYSIAMIEAGIGIVLMPDFLLTPHHLVYQKLKVLPFETNASAQLGIMCHKSFYSDKVRLFVDIATRYYSDPETCGALREIKRKIW